MKDYENDPEQYWRDKEERKEQDGKEKITRWEKENPQAKMEIIEGKISLTRFVDSSPFY